MKSLVLFLGASIALWGADVAGAWKTSYTNSEGQTRESTLTLKVDNGKLSGEFSSARGKAPISEGSVEGDRISFTVVRKANYDEVPVKFTGTVSGDTMRLKMQIRDRAPLDMTATRAK